MMMPIGLPVGGQVHELGFLRVGSESGHEPLDQVIPAVEQSFECYPAGEGSMIKEEHKLFSAGQAAQIRPGGVEVLSGDFRPGGLPHRPHASGLMRRQDSELDPVCG